MPSMSDFIGLTMLVTLRSPPGAQLHGKVSSVVAGQSLTLRDGMFHDGSFKGILADMFSLQPTRLQLAR